jgi:acetyl esterase/lipase
MLAAYSAGHAELPPSTDVPPVTVHNVISLYGPCDAALQYRLGDSTDLVQAAMKQYIGGSPEEFPDRYRLLSPLHHIGPKTPPTIMLLGTCDRIVRPDQSIALDEALTKAGVSHENYLLPDSDHAFDVNWGGFTTQIARAKIEDFLQFH